MRPSTPARCFRCRAKALAHPGLVGSNEADAGAGLLSVTSPLGRALIGKALGDVVEVTTPRGSRSYEVVKIAYG